MLSGNKDRRKKVRLWHERIVHCLISVHFYLSCVVDIHLSPMSRSSYVNLWVNQTMSQSVSQCNAFASHGTDFTMRPKPCPRVYLNVFILWRVFSAFFFFCLPSIYNRHFGSHTAKKIIIINPAIQKLQLHFLCFHVDGKNILLKTQRQTVYAHCGFAYVKKVQGLHL